jgi:exosortase A-associated hydrolase 1
MNGTPSPTTWHEQPLLLNCEGESLFAVLSRPADAISDVGVVIVVGGPQYRTGSHRQFVHLARSLAASGTPTLRFDARGMGDSTGERRPFTDMTADITAAFQGFRRACPSVSRVVLCGLCDGASAILLHLEASQRADVAGLILMNPWVRSGVEASSVSLVKHYYVRRLLDRAFWSRLLRGELAPGSLRDFFGHALRTARPSASSTTGHNDSAGRPYPDRMALALSAHAGPVLLVLSGADLTASEFIEHANSHPGWTECLRRPQVHRLDMQEADHTFSDATERQAVEAACIAFTQALHDGTTSGAYRTTP